MSIAGFCVRRPVFTTMLIALFVLAFIPQITLWLPARAGYVAEGTFH